MSVVQFLLIALGVVVWAAVVAGLAYFARWAWTDDTIGARWMGVGGAIATAAAVILGIAYITGDFRPFTSVPDGCYRIGSSTSVGVGVGVSANGGTTVVPVVLSGRTYEPIGCPS